MKTRQLLEMLKSPRTLSAAGHPRWGQRRAQRMYGPDLSGTSGLQAVADRQDRDDPTIAKARRILTRLGSQHQPVPERRAAAMKTWRPAT